MISRILASLPVHQSTVSSSSVGLFLAFPEQLRNLLSNLNWLPASNEIVDGPIKLKTVTPTAVSTTGQSLPETLIDSQHEAELSSAPKTTFDFVKPTQILLLDGNSETRALLNLICSNLPALTLSIVVSSLSLALLDCDLLHEANSPARPQSKAGILTAQVLKYVALLTRLIFSWAPSFFWLLAHALRSHHCALCLPLYQIFAASDRPWQLSLFGEIQLGTIPAQEWVVRLLMSRLGMRKPHPCLLVGEPERDTEALSDGESMASQVISGTLSLETSDALQRRRLLSAKHIRFDALVWLGARTLSTEALLDLARQLTESEFIIHILFLESNYIRCIPWFSYSDTFMYDTILWVV
ncbi:unnamed protein product [Protopolystoma xenopodis]|uniref:Uncharacterized protein n=1 Tax=Protopolystoma xenopodis TaxID=117903 RepID=A0A3S5A3Q0_9PLAT|nr:unnamed protein product [Protopolystoma xenopodis]